MEINLYGIIFWGKSPVRAEQRRKLKEAQSKYTYVFHGRADAAGTRCWSDFPYRANGAETSLPVASDQATGSSVHVTLTTNDWIT